MRSARTGRKGSNPNVRRVIRTGLHQEKEAREKRPAHLVSAHNAESIW